MFRSRLAALLRDVDWDQVENLREKNMRWWFVQFALGAGLVVAVATLVWFLFGLAISDLSAQFTLAMPAVPPFIKVLVVSGAVLMALRWASRRSPGWATTVLEGSRPLITVIAALTPGRTRETDIHSLKAGSTIPSRTAVARSTGASISTGTGVVSWMVTVAAGAAGLFGAVWLATEFFGTFVAAGIDDIAKPLSFSTTPATSTTTLSATVAVTQWMSSAVTSRSLVVVSGTSVASALMSGIPRWALRRHRARAASGEIGGQVEVVVLDDIKEKDGWQGLVRPHQADGNVVSHWSPLASLALLHSASLRVRFWIKVLIRRLYIVAVSCAVVFIAVSGAFLLAAISVLGGLMANLLADADATAHASPSLDSDLLLFKVHAAIGDLAATRWAAGLAFAACVIAILSTSLIWARRD